MAKQKKGGLGRGLDALMVSAPMETTPSDEGNTSEASKPETAPTQKQDNAGPSQHPSPTSSNQKPATESSGGSMRSSNSEKKADENKLPVKRIGQPRGPHMDSEGPYEINEDKTTIKGVVSREVAPQSPQRPKNDAKVARPAMQQTQHVEEPRETDEIDIRLIVPNPDQPRTSFKKEELEELAESIEKNGLLQPILVRKDGQKYQIIAGERRYQACKLLGLKKVPVRIRETDDDETLILALIENIQRSDLNPIEEAYGYRRMMERGKMTQTQVAQAVSKGRSTIANALRLLELPEDAQQLLFEEKITAGHARAILSVPGKEDRAKLTKKLKEEQLSVRETEALARLMSGKKETKKAPKPQTPKSYKTVARSLRDALQTDVHVRSTKDKNKIEIIFKDEADLERLYRLLIAE